MKIKVLLVDKLVRLIHRLDQLGVIVIDDAKLAALTLDKKTVKEYPDRLKAAVKRAEKAAEDAVVNKAYDTLVTKRKNEKAAEAQAAGFLKKDKHKARPREWCAKCKQHKPIRKDGCFQEHTTKKGKRCLGSQQPAPEEDDK
jgi:hypothetical protein